MTVQQSAKLYFHLVRLGESHCELCPDRDPAGFLLPPKGPVYLALAVKFQERMHDDTFTAVVRCVQHIPEGSWLEGRDRSTKEPDPEGDRIAEYIARQYLVAKAPGAEAPGLLVRGPRPTATSRARAQSIAQPAHGHRDRQRHPDQPVQSIQKPHAATVRRVFEP